ncbi:hypothetical protein M501DRAFT_1003455 [Patellaria atrata CBS 101060]|uniref:Phytase-like domain-containing protein n=1 Tax=Patellaria atrata CBS 101060 TaxID=1346257 RepID=A0A9P4VSK8_9PEZI|nr:hypothetical protein M501DRAFT_1003455 [Patellaria atrata CBS 101060]
MDRNTEGTTAYQPRIHIFSITFSPTTQSPSPPNLAFEYEDTILFSDPSGTPISGLDPTTVLKFRGYPDIPAATFTGNGFGGNGPGGTRVSIDPEGLVLDSRGGFWISDEYGPYIYHFTSKGRMNIAIRPTPAFIPLRNGTQSFASNNPPVYNPDQVPVPEIPTSGRSNNQGFEGLSYDPEKKALYTLLQSATIQDGGTAGTTRRHARLLKYDLSHRHGRAPRLVGEYVVRLPVFNDPTETKNPRTAAQSEILALGDGRFLLLARDSGFGRGQDETESVYRHIDVFSLASATNILGAYDGHNGSVSPAGVLKPDITAAETCSFLDINISSELAKFGLLNGGTDNDALGLLNEKWEGLALVPVEGHRGEYWLFASSDNDFITQEGYQNFGRDAFADSSGFNLLNQMLVFRVSIK